jgi:hypothetical protein
MRSTDLGDRDRASGAEGMRAWGGCRDGRASYDTQPTTPAEQTSIPGGASPRNTTHRGLRQMTCTGWVRRSSMLRAELRVF